MSPPSKSSSYDTQALVTSMCRENRDLLVDLTTEVQRGIVVVQGVNDKVERLERIVIVGNTNPSLMTEIGLVKSRLKTLEDSSASGTAEDRADRRHNKRMNVMVAMCVLTGLFTLVSTAINFFKP